MSALAVGSTACGGEKEVEGVDRQVCIALREHFVELRLQSVVGVDIAAHRQALTKALGEGFVTQCQHDYTSETTKCLLAAKDEAAARVCQPSMSAASTSGN
jgi:hypothetical protein